MTPVDYTDPRRADAMRQCSEGRGVFLPPTDPLLYGHEGLAVAKLLVVGLVLATIALGMVVMWG